VIDRVVASTAAVSTASVLPAFLLGAMGVQIGRDLGFGSAELGLAFATFFVAAALVSAPGGRLADARHPVVVTRVAATSSGVVSLLVAGVAQSLPVLLVCLAIAGAANAVCQTGANLVIVRALPVQRQGFALAVKQSAIPAAAMLAGLAVPGLALTFGWRWAYVMAAALAFITTSWIPRVTAEPLREEKAVGSRSRTDVPTRVMVLLAVAVALAGTAASSLGSFLVSAAVASDVSEGAAGLLLTASSIAGIATRLTAGALADRRVGGHFKVAGLMVGGGAVTFAALGLASPVAYLIAAPLAFCTAWAWPGLVNLAVVRVNPSAPASATGIVQTGQCIGWVAGPLLFGIVAESAGYSAAWLATSGVAVLATLALTAARSRIDEPAPTPVPVRR
jgi:MFS family permease